MRVIFIAALIIALIACVATAHPGHGALGGKQSAAVKAAGEEFLAKKATEEGVYTLPSGLMFKILRKGHGTKSPRPADSCDVHYAGTLPDGTKFDSSYDRGQPATFRPNQVIKGWTEALQLMREGDKWETYIPYNLAYGESGRPPKIPGFSPLVFTMQLMKVKAHGIDVSDAVFETNFGKKYEDM